MADIYNDSTYLSNNPTWHEEDAPFKAGKIADLLNNNNISFKTVAEAGCGSGQILVELAKKFPAVKSFKGFDISKDALAIATTKASNKISFELIDIANVEAVFDVLLVIDVIEHLENYFAFLNAIRSKAKYTVFHIPLDMCLWSLFREQMLIESKNRVGHIHNFTEDFVINILAGKGFKLIDKLYTEPTFKVISGKQKFINSVRKILFKTNKRFCMKTIGGYSVMLLTQNDNKKI